MNILIVSDSHGLTEELKVIKNKHMDEIDHMIHCGDSELSIAHNAIEDFIIVKGNCDIEKRFPEEVIQEIDGYRLLVVHGHQYGVKHTLMNLHYRAAELDADIVCFGHSHILGVEIIAGKLFINPGSICLPRKRIEKTYVILRLENNYANISIFEYEKGELTELKQRFPLPKK
ncbi:metallophosphoesterase [Bacillus aquiflavi]|uniref:Phosphoesterase n=1 Tax=Bacillus aquiflavi TaxID=2672567 RepID=A0A6B3VUQ8_9BACI|nr:metallophosphoesterase [Bacillus aquiflavi]MBA4537484.1 metallophosphoesterase [Bacillus aquiflavi]NEY81739.1 metallophosphoesterase [Bacillus aquiflavi]UAC47452.1 metallophosphoesterase [Bacillus aquiflavi]